VRVHNPLALVISVLQFGAGFYEFYQSRPYLGVIWVSVAVANVSMATMP